MWNENVVTSAALTLTSTFQNVQAQSGGDLVISLPGPYTVANIQFEVDFQATPTDDAEWEIIGSVDGVTYDTQAIAGSRLSNTTDPARVSIPVSGYKKLKVRARQTGATDTTNSAVVRYDIGD